MTKNERSQRRAGLLSIAVLVSLFLLAIAGAYGFQYWWSGVVIVALAGSALVLWLGR